MKYIPELYYFFDQRKTFPYRKAVSVTTQTVSQWCSDFEAKIITPNKGEKSPDPRSGKLPENAAQKGKFIEELLNWLFGHSFSEELFVLFMDTAPIQSPTGKERPYCPKFCHHDDTCCWDLELTDEQFRELQKAWKDNGFPEGLFYLPEKTIRVAHLGRFAKFMNSFGFSFTSEKLYSPKRWEAEKKNSKQNNDVQVHTDGQHLSS